MHRLGIRGQMVIGPLGRLVLFGSNAAAWWGFHYKDLLTEPKPREVVTIYEVDATGERNWAKAVYNFRWTPQTDCVYRKLNSGVLVVKSAKEGV